MSEQEPVDLGGLIADAAEANDATVAENIIRSGEFIIFQQIDLDSGEVEADDDGNFSVVLAEVDEELAVVCFSNQEAADAFAKEIGTDLPEGRELPAVTMDGNMLIDGLPEDCGLLVNPGTELESFFPPGCFLWDDEDDDDSEVDELEDDDVEEDDVEEDDVEEDDVEEDDLEEEGL